MPPYSISIVLKSNASGDGDGFTIDSLYSNFNGATDLRVIVEDEEYLRDTIDIPIYIDQRNDSLLQFSLYSEMKQYSIDYTTIENIRDILYFRLPQNADQQTSSSSKNLQFAWEKNDFLDVDTAGTLVGDAGWNILVNEQNYLLITGSYGSSEISTDGTLFRLQFDIPDQVPVNFVPINITHVEIDETEEVIEITNGGIMIDHLIYGDVSLNDNVSLFDASLILKYLVGTETLDEIQLTVADVTQDSTVSALDATAIAQYVVEIIDELPVDNTQNLSGGGEFVINEDEFSPGNLLEIPVLLTGGNNLLSFEFDISYDSDIVTFENVEWSEMISYFTIEENIEDGSIRFAGMGTTPDGEEGVFTNVSLFVASDFSGESIDLST